MNKICLSDKMAKIKIPKFREVFFILSLFYHEKLIKSIQYEKQQQILVGCCFDEPFSGEYELNLFGMMCHVEDIYDPRNLYPKDVIEVCLLGASR